MTRFAQSLRTEKERTYLEQVEDAMSRDALTRVEQAQHFPLYAPRQDLTRYLCRERLFMRALRTQGAIVECGVGLGGGLMWWAQLSVIFEPFNHARRVIGFDTFEGHRGVCVADKGGDAERGGSDIAEKAPVITGKPTVSQDRAHGPAGSNPAPSSNAVLDPALSKITWGYAMAAKEAMPCGDGCGHRGCAAARRMLNPEAREGGLAADSQALITEAARLYDLNRPIGHIPRVVTVRGDARETIPEYVQAHPHLIVSLLYLDFDIYEPTKVALEHFLPRMPKGAIVAFDECNVEQWPGETRALLESEWWTRNIPLKRFPWGSLMCWAEMV